MNRIPRPNYNDNQALQTLAQNTGAGSYPNLQPAVVPIQAGYQQYEAVGGNAFQVLPVPLTEDQAAFLKGHYRQPNADLPHIDELRDARAYQVCPMCGSLHSGTLDHLLPQADYPEFAIFSLNLVPACKCNLIRQNVFKGVPPGERILHPYFDACLSDRLVAAQFTDLGEVPNVALKILVDAAHPEYEAVEFHVRTVVQRTAVEDYLSDRWTSFCRKPSLVIRALAQPVLNAQSLEAVLREELDLLDDLHRGKNSWNSIFVAGLLDPSVRVWLFERLTEPGRAADAPLIGL